LKTNILLYYILPASSYEAQRMNHLERITFCFKCHILKDLQRSWFTYIQTYKYKKFHWTVA